jgi:hypothetical protein
MRKFAAAALAVTLLVPPAAQAAEMTLRKDKTGRPMVVINGDIEFGDFEKFIKVAGKLPPGTIVGLNSEGGAAIDALEIGHVVRHKRFLTVAGSVCASACAFIWLAGVDRGAFEDSLIGFHNAYDGATGQATGAGNAVVGAYLTKLGFSYKTIIFMTDAKSDEMAWLNFEKAKELGIKVTRLQGTKKTAQPQQPQMQPKQPQQTQVQKQPQQIKPVTTAPAAYQWPPSPYPKPETSLE